MNVAEVKKKVKNERIREIMWKIDHHQVKSDEEWLQFSEELDAYAHSDIPDEVKRLFYPIGYLEMTTVIADGIRRWRNSPCAKCRRQQECEKYHCSAYQEGIPNEIWAHENAVCSHFEPIL